MTNSIESQKGQAHGIWNLPGRRGTIHSFHILQCTKPIKYQHRTHGIQNLPGGPYSSRPERVVMPWENRLRCLRGSSIWIFAKIVSTTILCATHLACEKKVDFLGVALATSSVALFTVKVQQLLSACLYAEGDSNSSNAAVTHTHMHTHACAAKHETGLHTIDTHKPHTNTRKTDAFSPCPRWLSWPQQGLQCPPSARWAPVQFLYLMHGWDEQEQWPKRVHDAERHIHTPEPPESRLACCPKQMLPYYTQAPDSWNLKYRSLLTFTWTIALPLHLLTSQLKIR